MGQRPWFRGTPANPSGYFCKICYNVFAAGGFFQEHESIKKYLLLAQLSQARGTACVSRWPLSSRPCLAALS
eukprot:8252999-Alexandrium_andersonii.AAC.1